MSKLVIIPDTNFIREHTSDFIEVLKVLKKHGDVFMSEITIEERIAQERIEIRRDYAKIEEVKSKYSHIADVSFKQSLEDRIKTRVETLLKNYKSVIGDNIIKFDKSEKEFSLVLERAYDKIPPFSQSSQGDKNPSDKGFKDTLLWFSLLRYFEKERGKEVILITNDNGFIKNAEYLQKEFADITGCKIQICGGEYYQGLIAEKTTTKTEKEKIKSELSAIELHELRKEINETMDDICTIWDNEIGEQQDTFSVKANGITLNSVERAFENMKNTIDKNIFNAFVSAKDFWGEDIYRGIYNISIEKYIRLNALYENIKNNYGQYLPQFFHTVQSIINRNNDSLPF
ncbi:MAG: PIN domain-containing protein [Christensenellaceae bacterium]|jgi:hypothetical protein|nr:PIN domain-containing protein [Christensenellaceae bacterium]